MYAGAGFVEYGARRKDSDRAHTGRRIFEETYTALGQNHFVTEPDPTPPDRILENPSSVALDLANECVKQIDAGYLRHGAALVTHLLGRYYLPEKGYFVEYVTLDGHVFEDEEGRRIVDPGHLIEFCCFTLEFARLVKGHPEFAEVMRRIDQVIPNLLKWNVRTGWNAQHPGIYETIDAESGRPVNDTMPWWILPETMLALILSYEHTGYLECLEMYRDTACKFQDPEFHSGKNLLSVVEVAKRIGLA